MNYVTKIYSVNINDKMNAPLENLALPDFRHHPKIVKLASTGITFWRGQLTTLLQPRIQHRRFPVNLTKFLRTSFSIELP